MEGTDTIAAISTPYGKGGIAVIRISGSKAIEISSKVFIPKGSRDLSVIEGGKTVYGEILSEGETIDDGIAAVFRAPHSFTGEDTVEISCHGGIILTQTVLEAVLTAGARPAEAGEFSKRAFLAGKISMSQAEAIINLIDAESREKMKISAAQSKGILTEKIDGIRSELTDIIASIYAYIDYPDEDLTDIPSEKIKEKIIKIKNELCELCDTYRAGHAISEGIKTVIAGKPNTGKSSLLNALLGEKRAIVTSVAGTTRDTVEETVSVGKVLLRLCDTAGIRSTDDEVEMLGVERSMEKLSEAELVLAVFDGSQELTDQDRDVIGKISESKKNVITVINKSDIGSVIDDTEIGISGSIVHISAETGAGIDKLKKIISELYVNGEINYNSVPVLTGIRQYSAARKTVERLTDAVKAIDSGFTQDVSGFDLESALASLGELDGRTASEEVTSRIFSRFCVGK